MMIITIITLFPEVIKPFLNHSILGRAQKKKNISFNLINPRDFTQNKHHTVDDRPYGGGTGMLLMIEPLVKAIEAGEKEYGLAYKILLSPQGKPWNQKIAQQLVENSQSQLKTVRNSKKQIKQSEIRTVPAVFNRFQPFLTVCFLPILPKPYKPTCRPSFLAQKPTPLSKKTLKNPDSPPILDFFSVFSATVF